MKVSEIRDLLTEKGIEYDPKAKKEELVKLLG
ncbi:HeH/LEM domain-containing protein [Proteus terrae]